MSGVRCWSLVVDCWLPSLGCCCKVVLVAVPVIVALVVLVASVSDRSKLF